MRKRPYRLPYEMTIAPEEVASGVSMKTLDQYILEHQGMFQRYSYLENLYKGFHDIFKQPDKEDWKPDNRLSVNFPRYMTETFTGYGYGIPIKVSHPDEAVSEAIDAFEKQNEITDHDAEMIKRCCIYGHAFEYFYQNEEHETKVSELTPKDAFCVYSDDRKKQAVFAVNYGFHGEKSKHPGQKFGEVLTHDEIIRFEGDEFTDRQPNPYYGLLPIVEWRLNDERLGLYESAAGLIELYDHTLSEKGNDVDAFADAYLAILGAELDEDQVYRIRDDRVINFYGTDDAKDILVNFLQKPTADGTQENLLTRLENLIYQTSMVANISDESFGNATSGTALAYKLQAMSNLAATFDRKIEKSIRKRYKIFCSLATNVSDPDAYKDIEVKFTRNLPKNLAEEAQTAQTLEGMVSKETQLSVLSIVNDPKEEIEKMEDEEEKSRRDSVTLANLFRSPAQATADQTGEETPEAPEAVNEQ